MELLAILDVRYLQCVLKIHIIDILTLGCKQHVARNNISLSHCVFNAGWLQIENKKGYRTTIDEARLLPFNYARHWRTEVLRHYHLAAYTMRKLAYIAVLYILACRISIMLNLSQLFHN